MKKNIIRFTRLLVGVTILLSVSAMPVLAADNGGAVQTDGVVDFYEETIISTTESNVPKTQNSSVAPSPTKPRGRYPSTGELVKRSLGISGFALIVFVLFYFLLKKRKGKEGGTPE